MMPLASWRDEWRRNPRLRLGAAGIALLLLVWGALVAEEAVNAQRDALQGLRRDHERLLSLQREAHWPARRDALRLLDTEWRSALWQAPSDGQMQAQFQDWLRAQLLAGGMKPRELQVTVLADAAPAARLRARAGGELNVFQLHELLLRLAEAPGLTRVTRLTVRQQPPAAQIEIELEALYARTVVAAEPGRAASATAQGAP